MAEDHTRYDFKSERTVYEDLNEYFAGFEGSFVLYDLQADQYHIYNENKSTLRVSPDSTYKIFSALFALESNVITSENSTMKWNGNSILIMLGIRIKIYLQQWKVQLIGILRIWIKESNGMTASFSETNRLW